MTTIDFLSHLRADSARFVEGLASCDPAAPVPTCDGWTASDLLWHLGEVQHFWGEIVRDRLTDPEVYEEPPRPADHASLTQFFHESSAMLIDALASTADDVPVWSWLASDQSVGFVRRRQAHEALIHRFDAELTAGAVTALDPDLATDGVLEAIEWMFSNPPTWSTAVWDGPVGALRTTDTGASWLVQVGRWSGTSPNTGKTYADEGILRLAIDGAPGVNGHIAPTFEISATARDLDAWMWNRPTLATVERRGDSSAFESVIRAGVQ